MVTAPLEFGLKPRLGLRRDLQLQRFGVCRCGSACCDGYTEFCCTLNGVERLPARHDHRRAGGRSTARRSAAAPPATTSTATRRADRARAATATCSGACSGVGCGCAGGDCNNRKSGCTRFRYGQCNQDVACVGPIVCRVVTCARAVDRSIRHAGPARGPTRRPQIHDRPCLDDPWGVARPGDRHRWGDPRLRGWPPRTRTSPPPTSGCSSTTGYVLQKTADCARPDVKAAYPHMSANTGFDGPSRPPPATTSCAPGRSTGTTAARP